MGLSVRIVPMERSILATIRADLSPANQKKVAAAFAQVGIDEAKAINRRILGRDPPVTITVDGRKNARLESVNPDGGTIIAEFEMVDALLVWIIRTLVDRSPVVSGAYIDGHKLFADGTEVMIGGEAIPDADEYVFTNLVPYARKIEVGKTKTGRPFVIQVDNKIYERTAKDARGKFGNVADISFAFRKPLGAYELQHDQPSRDFTSGSLQIRPGIRKDRRRGSAVIPPAIIVRHKKK